MSKINISMLLTALIFVLFVQPVEAATINFKDVDKNNSHYEGIHYLTERGIISGYKDNTYKPDRTITRSQTAALFTKALNLPKEKFIKVYRDVDKNHEYADAIISSWRAGIFNRTASHFNDGPLTREQMATVLVNAYDLKDNGKAVNAKFANISPSHRGNVKILFQQGITNQKKDYRPSETVTRGQFATFLYKVIKNKASDEIQNDDKVKNDTVVVYSEKELANALSSSSSYKIVELGNDIKLIDTIYVKNDGAKIKGYSNNLTYKLVGSPGKTVFKVEASNVHFDQVTVIPNNSIAFHVVSREGFQLTHGFIRSVNDSSSGIIVEDKYAAGVDASATITDTAIIVPNIGVSFAGGILRLKDNLIENALTGLKFTSIESPRQFEGNIFFSNFEDINIDWWPERIDMFLPLNHFDYKTPKINLR